MTGYGLNATLTHTAIHSGLWSQRTTQSSANTESMETKNVDWLLIHLLVATAHSTAIYKGEKFSDHAPVTIAYGWAL